MEIADLRMAALLESSRAEAERRLASDDLEGALAVWRAVVEEHPTQPDARAEIEFHIESRATRLIREGWPEEQAWAEARRRFGDVDRVQSEVEHEMTMRRRTMRWMTWVDGLATDLRVGLRQWRTDPGTGLLALLTLMLGIGATCRTPTAIADGCERLSGDLIHCPKTDIRG